MTFAHRRLYATLERRVEERTQELAGANRELARSLVTLRDTQDQLLQAGKSPPSASSPPGWLTRSTTRWR